MFLIRTFRMCDKTFLFRVPSLQSRASCPLRARTVRTSRRDRLRNSKVSPSKIYCKWEFAAKKTKRLIRRRGFLQIWITARAELSPDIMKLSH